MIVKGFAYTVALITVLRTVQRSAANNDQLALRDEAGSMSRALIVMLVADLFYQLTYGVGGVGILGVIGSLLVGCYWIYCHVRLARFLYNAAYFVNEPHDLPIATVIRDDSRTPRGSQPAARSSQPAAPPPQPVARISPPPPAPTPDPESTDEGGDEVDGPRFLR